MLPIFTFSSQYKWLAVILLAGGCYGWGRMDGAAIAGAGVERDGRLVNEALAAAQRGAANEIAKLEVKHVTVQRRVERETREVPVYRDCRHSPDGLRAVNAALADRAEPAGGGELPGEPGRVERRFLRGDNGNAGAGIRGVLPLPGGSDGR